MSRRQQQQPLQQPRQGFDNYDPFAMMNEFMPLFSEFINPQAPTAFPSSRFRSLTGPTSEQQGAAAGLTGAISPWTGVGQQGWLASPDWLPQVSLDVISQGDSYLVNAECPGLIRFKLHFHPFHSFMGNLRLSD
jgi:hypothetical protein